MINQETGVRGYALSGRPSRCSRTTSIARRNSTTRRPLRTYVTGNEHLIVLLNQFQARVGVWQVADGTAADRPRSLRVTHKAAIRVDSVADKARFDDGSGAGGRVVRRVCRASCSAREQHAAPR